MSDRVDFSDELLLDLELENCRPKRRYSGVELAELLHVDANDNLFFGVLVQLVSCLE